MAVTETKSERIDIRTTYNAKEVLQRAALASHKSVSEFLLDAALAAAEEALANRRAFRLEEPQWQAFEEALNRPVRNKPRLARLLSEKSVLE